MLEIKKIQPPNFNDEDNWKLAEIIKGAALGIIITIIRENLKASSYGDSNNGHLIAGVTIGVIVLTFVNGRYISNKMEDIYGSVEEEKAKLNTYLGTILFVLSTYAIPTAYQLISN